MNKIRVFVSSRVNSMVKKSYGIFSLEDLRAYLRVELEKEAFLGEEILDVLINEASFDGSIEQNAFNKCMDTMRSCNIIIVLYNGEAGWNITGNAQLNGICHEEFLIAMAEFSSMSFIMDISDFFDEPKQKDKKKNDQFKADIEISYLHKETIKAKTIDELKQKVLTQAKQYILAAIEKSIKTQKQIVAASSTFGPTLTWSEMSYAEREKGLVEHLRTGVNDLAPFKEIIKNYRAVPDNMSVADARNSIGRPFLFEQDLLQNKKEKSGVIHFVAVYGNVTVMQVKNLIGFPDIAVIKTAFGFYVWEKKMHIQMFFLSNCVNPQTVRTRLTDILLWLTTSKETQHIGARAKARFSILEAMNKVSDVK